MTKSILLACGLAAFTAASCTQAPEKATPGKAPVTSEASPLVVSGSGKLDLDAKESRGLLLKMEGKRPGYLRVEWGATRQALGQAMASLAGRPADEVLKCGEQRGEMLCFTGDESPWSGDLGQPPLENGMTPAFLFSPDGRFYHYMVLAPSNRLDAARAAFNAEFGAPIRDEKSVLRTLWKLGHTVMVVEQTPDGGTIHGVYVPIARKTQ